MSHWARRVDQNQARIVEDLRRAGAAVQSIAAAGRGCGDLLVGWRGRLCVLEVKNPRQSKSRRALSPLERKWHLVWAEYVHIVTTTEGAYRAVGIMDCLEERK